MVLLITFYCLKTTKKRKKSTARLQEFNHNTQHLRSIIETIFQLFVTDKALLNKFIDWTQNKTMYGTWQQANLTLGLNSYPLDNSWNKITLYFWPTKPLEIIKDLQLYTYLDGATPTKLGPNPLNKPATPSCWRMKLKDKS